MCVMSMIYDHYNETWPRRYPIYPQPRPMPFIPAPLYPQPRPSQDELDEFKRLLERAREYDKQNNEPECEMVEKKRILKELAEKLGVDISFIDDV